jgi:hypothetical protein
MVRPVFMVVFSPELVGTKKLVSVASLPEKILQIKRFFVLHLLIARPRGCVLLLPQVQLGVG